MVFLHVCFSGLESSAPRNRAPPRFCYEQNEWCVCVGGGDAHLYRSCMPEAALEAHRASPGLKQTVKKSV